jgi:uncharacterized phage-associated protein
MDSRFQISWISPGGPPNIFTVIVVRNSVYVIMESKAKGLIFVNKKKMENTIYLMLDRLNEVPTIKLAKLLYYADFMHYRKTHKSITDSTYLHLEHGPCASDFQNTLSNLGASGNVVFAEKKYKGERAYKAYKTNTAPDMGVFSKSEIETLDEVIKRFGRMSGEKLREKTHGEFPWKATKPYDKIPYSFAQYIDVPMDGEEEPEDKYFRNNKKLERVVDSIAMKRAATKVKGGNAKV